MKELTEHCPKPMLEVAGKPVLEHTLGRLRQAGFTQALIVTGYRAEMIEGYFRGYPMEIGFVRQTVAEGTGQAAMLAREWTDEEPFLLTFADILIDTPDYLGVASKLEGNSAAPAAVALNWVEDPAAGAAVYEQDGRMIRIVEKPAPGTSNTHWNSAGAFAFRDEIFAELERVPRSSRGEYELTSAIVQLLDRGRPVLVHPLTGFWRDVGRPEDLVEAARILTKKTP
jgi:NDP-sugar pyrophosphorylase family protein